MSRPGTTLRRGWQAVRNLLRHNGVLRGARKAVRLLAGRAAGRGGARDWPHPRPRVVIWARALQTDILVLTHALIDSGVVEVLVVAGNRDALAREPIQQVKPLRCRLLRPDHITTVWALRRFRANLVIIDDEPPDFQVAPRLLYLWHGLGMWKVKPRGEIDGFPLWLSRHVGDVRQPNRRFRAQCYGEPSRNWWITEWGFAAESCIPWGMAYSDWLLAPPYSRAEARHAIGLPAGGGPTFLLCLSWHYGSRFGTWQDLADIVAVVADAATERDGHVLLCLHDRCHYDPAALDRITQIVRRCSNIVLRHKNEHPDNLADLLAADVMICNYSSLLGYFYVSGKPSIHLDPRHPDGTMPDIMSWVSGRLAPYRVGAGDVWLNSLDDHGGLVAHDRDTLLAAVAQAVDDPTCCRERSRQFLDRHVIQMDGHTADRMSQDIVRWVGATIPGDR
jgi:hypothetical protein